MGKTCVKYMKVEQESKEKPFVFCEENADSNMDRIIWQQMPLKFFENIVVKKELCFKQLSEYSKKYERGLQFYLSDNYCTKDASRDRIIKNLVSDFEKIVYIACWYDKPTLADVLFREYARGGVAIGVRVSKLIDALQQSGFNHEIYCGNTFYVENTRKKVISTDSTEREVVAPLFLKATNFTADQEFRVLCINDSLWQSNASGMCLPEKIDPCLFLKIGEVTDLIEFVAIKEGEDPRGCFFDIGLEQNNLSLADCKDHPMDGFTIYRLIQTKTI